MPLAAAQAPEVSAAPEMRMEERLYWAVTAWSSLVMSE